MACVKELGGLDSTPQTNFVEKAGGLGKQLGGSTSPTHRQLNHVHIYVHRCKKTVVRTVYGNSKGFEVKRWVSKFSIKSTVICDCHGTECRVALLWELQYADDLAVIAETEDELIMRLNDLQ